jgi:hypothetical protein
MPLKYNPEHAAPFKPKPGTYAFVVKEVRERVFKSGATGVTVELKVDVGHRFALSCVDNIVFSETATWKMKALCDAVGVRFDPPAEASDFPGKTGRARFGVEEYEGFLQLRVLEYFPLPEPR